MCDVVLKFFVHAKQNKAEADGGGLRVPEAVVREPDRREPAAETRAPGAAAVDGGVGGSQHEALCPAPQGGGHHELMPVLREGRRE